MEKTKKCKNCGSGDAAEGRIKTQETGQLSTIEVAVDRRPGKIFRNPIKSAITARICSNCDLVELYAKDPAKLYEVFLETQKALIR